MFFEAYYRVLKNYSNHDVMKAVDKCVDELTFYPAPKEIAERIEGRVIDKHSKELSEAFTCQVCREKVTALSDGVCLDCAQINPQLAGIRFKPEYQPYQKDDYRMHGRMRCSECGKGPTLCIRKPSKTGPWLCTDCYRGYDQQHLIQRWRDVMKMIRIKNYMPDWAF